MSIFLLTRFYKIESIPPSLYWDEASIAYNAYSVSQSGKDEWGDFLPLHFRAFGEFKLPVYIYSSAISIKLFGLNEFSVRLPAVFFSLGILIITYFLTLRIFKEKKVALFSTFFLSTSSWLFLFSRVGYEVSGGLTFFLLGVYLMLISLEKKNFYILGVFAFIISSYSYNSFRVLAPLTLAIFFFIHIYISKAKNIVPFLIGLVIFVISLFPIVRLLIFDSGFGRVQSFTILPTIRRVYDSTNKPHLQFIFDRNKEVNVGNNVIALFKNYFLHFSPHFLLTEGDMNSRNHPKGFGQLFFPDIILVLSGTIITLRKKRLITSLPVILMFLAPIPAVIFKESPHALRSLAMVPFICILMGMGANYFASYFKKSVIIIVAIYLILFANFFQNFISQYPIQSSADWQYGYKRLFLEYKDQFENFDRVIISDQFAQPYIFALYYLKYNPEKFRHEVKYNSFDNWGFSTVATFGNFEFRKIKKEDTELKKVLIFATDGERLDNIEPIAQVKFLDGKNAFWVYSTK